MAPSPSVLAPGVLPHQAILELCGLADNELEESSGTGPIQPCRRRNVRSASYDLRLGPEFHFTDAPPTAQRSVRDLKVSRLKRSESEHIVIPPNQVVVVSSLEKVCLPKDMVGHLSLKQDILLQGLIMASQSQIDAGYRGWIYPLLYNLTDGEVTLQLDKSVIRLELVRLSEETDRPYDGDYQESPLAKSLKRPIGSSLTSLKQEVDAAQAQITRTRVFATVGAILVLAIPLAIPFLSGFVGDFNETRERVAQLEVQVEEPLKLEDHVARLESRVTGLQCQIRKQEGKLKSARC